MHDRREGIVSRNRIKESYQGIVSRNRIKESHERVKREEPDASPVKGLSARDRRKRSVQKISTEVWRRSGRGRVGRCHRRGNRRAWLPRWNGEVLPSQQSIVLRPRSHAPSYRAMPGPLSSHKQSFAERARDGLRWLTPTQVLTCNARHACPFPQSATRLILAFRESTANPS